MTRNPVPPKSLAAALDYVAKGGQLIIPTYTRCTVIDAKVVAKFEKAGEWLIREEGDGYRVRAGRGSVYVLPGQMLFH